MKRVIILLLSLAACISSPTNYESPLVITEHHGEYEAGFRHVVVEDSVRDYGSASRLISTYIWYPSNETTGQAMKYVQYAQAELASDSSNVSSAVKSYIELHERQEIYSSDSLGLLADLIQSADVMAYNDVPVAPGRFPLLLMFPGGSTPGYIHSIIAEYLAQRGYVIVSFSSLGPSPEERWRLNGGPQLHAADAQAIFTYLKSFEWIDTSSIAIAATSTAGISQAIFANDNPAIKLMISMDSGLEYQYSDEILTNLENFSYEQITYPYVSIVAEDKAMFEVERSTKFFDFINSDLKVQVVFPGLAHHHMNAFGGVVPDRLLGPVDDKTWESYLQFLEVLHITLEEVLNNTESKSADLLKHLSAVAGYGDTFRAYN